MAENVKKSYSDEELRRMVSDDISCAVAALNMLRNDPELMKAIQDIIIARTRTAEENAKLQPELELQ